MAINITGRLGGASIGTGTLTDIYTVPAGRAASVNVNVANRSDVDTSIRIAHIQNGVAASVGDDDYLMYDLPTSSLASNFAPIQLTGVLMGAGDTIAVRSSDSAVTIQVNGIEEDA